VGGLARLVVGLIESGPAACRRRHRSLWRVICSGSRPDRAHTNQPTGESALALQPSQRGAGTRALKAHSRPSRRQDPNYRTEANPDTVAVAERPARCDPRVEPVLVGLSRCSKDAIGWRLAMRCQLSLDSFRFLFHTHPAELANLLDKLI